MLRPTNQTKNQVRWDYDIIFMLVLQKPIIIQMVLLHAMTVIGGGGGGGVKEGMCPRERQIVTL